jgi:hypothetical protein
MSLYLLVYRLSQSTDLHDLIFQALLLESICKTNILPVVNYFRCVKNVKFSANCEVSYLFSTLGPRLSRFIFCTSVLSNVQFFQPQRGIWAVIKDKVASTQDLKAYEEVEVYLNSFLKSALNGCGLLPWSSGCFIPRKMSLICRPEEAWWTPQVLCKFRSRRKYVATAGNRFTFPLSASP